MTSHSRAARIAAVLRTSLLTLALLLAAHVAARAQETQPRLYVCMYTAPVPGALKNMHPVYPGAALSTDTGASWHALGWKNNRCVDAANPANDASTVYLAGDNGLLVSRDGGTTWKQATDWRIPTVSRIVLIDDSVFITTPMGVYLSTDKAASWMPRSYGLRPADGTYASDMLPSPGDFLLATNEGLYRSSDRGLMWKRGPLQGTPLERILRHPVSRDLLTAWGPTGMWRSEDGGQTWTKLTLGDPAPRVQGAAFDPSNSRRILIGTAGQGIMASKDGGATWALSSAGLTNLNITSLVFHPTIPSIVYAGTDNGTFVSRDGGAVWTPFSIRLGYVSAIRVQP